MKRIFTSLIFAALSVAQTHAQAWPNRTVTLVVAYAAGGTGDIVARLLSQPLSKALGQPVIVENRAGGSGGIGAKSVATAQPDGHTLLVGQTAEISINQHRSKNLNYDPDRDLLPIALAANVPLALAVPGKAPYSSMREFLAAMAVNTKKLSYASSGAGTPSHFAGELLRLKTKADIVHVPYNGAGPAMNELLGGHVDAYFPGLPAAVPQMAGGGIKVLAVSTAKRSALAPDLPTVAESAGIPEFDFSLWAGFFAPHGTPREVVDRLNREINLILRQTEMREKMLALGAEVSETSVEDFTAFARRESNKYRDLVESVGVRED